MRDIHVVGHQPKTRWGRLLAARAAWHPLLRTAIDFLALAVLLGTPVSFWVLHELAPTTDLTVRLIVLGLPGAILIASAGLLLEDGTFVVGELMHTIPGKWLLRLLVATLAFAMLVALLGGLGLFLLSLLWPSFPA